MLDFHLLVQMISLKYAWKIFILEISTYKFSFILQSSNFKCTVKIRYYNEFKREVIYSISSSENKSKWNFLTHAMNKNCYLIAFSFKTLDLSVCEKQMLRKKGRKLGHHRYVSCFKSQIWRMDNVMSNFPI